MSAVGSKTKLNKEKPGPDAITKTDKDFEEVEEPIGKIFKDYVPRVM